MPGLSLLFLFFSVVACNQVREKNPQTEKKSSWPAVYKTIGDIREPEGYRRITAPVGSFAGWLRKIPLKKDMRVFLYNGSLKPNQSAQFAVLDIKVGNKDLQQCADVVMRLRAEYLYAEMKYDQIAFMDFNGKWYKWRGKKNRPAFDSYLQTVFGWCGSASLDKQLKTIKNFDLIAAGDILVKGGFPGHAMLVADIAVNEEGKKVYMLVQGYQPAQDMHVVNNPMDKVISPWYAIDSADTIITPEWSFKKKELKTW